MRRWCLCFGLVFLAVAGCKGVPDNQLLRARLTGIAAERGIEPSPFTVVYIDEQPLDAAITTYDGRYHLATTVQGPATLTAIDLLGYATTRPLDLQAGSVIDLGVLPLSLCLGNNEAPPSNDAFGACPDTPLATTPPGALTIDAFNADVTDIVRVDAPLPSLSIHTKSFGQNLALNLLLPSDSAAYGPGTSNVGLETTDPSTSFILRQDPTSGELYAYVLVSSTLVTQVFEPTVNGEVAVRLNGATFAWFDPVNHWFDLSSTIQIQSTGDSIRGLVVSPPVPDGDGINTSGLDPVIPSTPDVSLGSLGAPSFAVLYGEADASVALLALFDIDADHQVVLDLRVPNAVVGSPTRTVNNSIDGEASTWTYTIPGVATYVENGDTYRYILQAATVTLTGGAQVGDVLQVDITGAHFVFTPDFEFAFPDYSLHIDDLTVSETVTASNVGGGP